MYVLYEYQCKYTLFLSTPVMEWLALSTSTHVLSNTSSPLKPRIQMDVLGTRKYHSSNGLSHMQ